MSLETKTDHQRNITFNHLLDGIYGHALEEQSQLISFDPSEEAEAITIANPKVRIKLTRPTLDGKTSEAWEAPWDHDTKLRMRLKLTALNGNQFGFKDTADNTYLLDRINLAVLEDGTVRPFFDSGSEDKVGEPISEKYLMELVASEAGEFVPVTTGQ